MTRPFQPVQYLQGAEIDRLEHDFYLDLNLPLVNPAHPDRYLILPDKELTFDFHADWQIGDYRSPSFYDSDHDRRSDLITTLGFGFSQTLLEDLEKGDVILHGLIDWTTAESNVTAQDRISPFTYDKSFMLFNWNGKGDRSLVSASCDAMGAFAVNR